ncbi:Protein FAM208A [Oryzias melastigma]|uniref:Protein FAM208A n=1 Tax=Oryzias melastigma TaxID=30732 RepID=A0A834CDJ2_ORYME|nr:Protein FAM208A [Oryzias melastigma]
MALNPGAVGKTDSDRSERAALHPGGGEPQKNSATTSATANQNGDQPGCRDGVMPEQEAPERRRSVQGDVRSCSSSPSPAHRPSEELPRRNFQIPRKTRERKGLYQFLPPDSREFEDLIKLISSFYLDPSSRASFSYSKARLIHNELLEKEFIEKRREMKQEGRTEPDLAESYCFLFPDKSKLQWICEKGLSVGHCRITTLGNPAVGVYLSKYSDLLQINPFEVGSFGDMIIFKIMRGRIKHIHENMPKNAIEPSPKFDCHLSKIANRVTSLLSYRAFELTQQFFFEFAFDEIKARPRHVCPYAVVSFQYKGKEAAGSPLTAHRFNTIPSEGSRGKSCYQVWSGPLINKDRELFPICLRSFSRPYLPFRLPEKLEMHQGMQLDQVKRKIPSVLFSWDTYSMSREVMKCGMSCSLFEVVDGKGKATNGSLAALISKLERDRMVLVKPLFDKGFLFLLSSTQMGESKERRGRLEKKLQALFIFQESRMVVKYSSRLFEPEPLTVEPQPAILSSMEPFVPALHYALFKLRPNPGKDISSGVERQATDYLTRMDSGTVRPFILPDYKYNVDERTTPLPVPRPKFNMDAVLRSYTHNPANYILPLNKAKDLMERIRNPVPTPPPQPAPAPVEYSPVSDWGGSDRGSDRAERPTERPPQMRLAQENPTVDISKRRPDLTQSNGAQLQLKTLAEPQPQPQKGRVSQNEYDKDKMKQLLKLIQLHKKTLVRDPGKDRGEDGGWDVSALKRKFEEEEERRSMNKHQRTDHLSNGEPSRAQADDISDEAGQNENLTAVMESMGIYDTDLRARGNADASAVNETQRLLKILLATLNKAVSQGAIAPQVNHGEPSRSAGRVEPPFSDLHLEKQNEPLSQTNYMEEDMDCSPGSPCSVGSPPKQLHCSDIPTGDIPTNADKEQHFPESIPKAPKSLEAEPMAESDPEPKLPSAPEVKAVAAPTMTVVEEVPFRPSISLDTIINQELHSLSSDIKNIMQSQHICYSNKLPSRFPLRHCWQPSSCFSDFVVPYVSPASVQGHVDALREKMLKLIPAPSSSAKVTSTTPPEDACGLTTPPPAPTQTSKPKTEPALPKGTASSQGGKTTPNKEMTSIKVKIENSSELGGEIYSPSNVTSESPEQNPAAAPAGGSNLLAGSLIGQLKPEVFSSLVEIFKDVTKNTVKFYIYSGDEGDESTVCKEIKEYLKSLGNSECSPQTFLENSGSLDKLLIIIRNEDIAAHVHKHTFIKPVSVIAMYTGERPFEMFLQYSRNGIVIASIDDVMSGFHSLIGSINQSELPTPPSTVNDECVEAEDMSLDSDDGEAPPASDPLHEVKKEKPPPLPEKEEFRPPLPDQLVNAEKTPTLLDSSSLKTAISQFKATNQLGLASADIGGMSPGGFPVNPHQSFLCPSTPWSSFTGSSSYSASPAYPSSPCSSTQEQEYRPPTTSAAAVVPTLPVMTPVVPLASMASLPLEVKPPPPPHLMVLGSTYGSDVGGAAGGSPLTPSLSSTSDMACNPNPTQHDRTLSGAGEGAWAIGGATTCDAAKSQGTVSSGPMDPAGLPKPGESLQGARTQVNCADSLCTPAGIPPLATRGGAVIRPKLPPHPMGGVGYGSIGGIPGPMDHGPVRGALGPGSLGNFRGRGVPPVGLWPRPGRGHELREGAGGGPCSWGHPAGRGGPQNYYMDYTYSHNYAPE